jgi:hypothetical protein
MNAIFTGEMTDNAIGKQASVAKYLSLLLILEGGVNFLGPGHLLKTTGMANFV